MSHDLMRRSQRPAGMPMTADDIWMQQQNQLATAAPGGGNEVQPLQVLHRSLRGRYKIAAIIAIAGAVAGTVLGWKMNERVYRASGLVKISPTNQTVVDSVNTTEYSRYMSSEASYIRTSEIIDRAMKKPDWTNVAGNNTFPIGAFYASLQSTYIANSQDILITFEHTNPAIATAAVDAVLKAYADYREESGRSGRERQTSYLEGQKTAVEAQMKAAREQISNLRREHDKGSIDKVAEIKGTRVAEYEARIGDQKMLLEQMEMLRAAAQKNPRSVPEDVIARRDPFFARLIDERNNAETELKRLSSSMGPNAPQVIKLKNQIQLLRENIDEIAKALSQEIYGSVARLDGKEGPPIEVSDASIDNQKEVIALLERKAAEMRQELSGVDNARLSIIELNDQIVENQKALTEIVNNLEIARAREQTINAPFRPVYPLRDASVAKDKRPTMATFGFVVGAGLPVLALALYGLFDRRFRYSDEATQVGGTRGIPLLGILPNLPDRLSDPSQASVAAHCVHQIRTMLQLNCLSDTLNCLSITSATSGDGKTSLALALGLSFAASGSRTLLIDTDLIGGGLSARLGIREAVGISEAVVARNPMEYVRETDVNGLSVLPVGTQGAQNASAFNPSAVRRMMAELRKHFDIVIVDTGPILGSIEATPVVAASDAVILTVARRQSRDLVEKAIGQLRAVGAHIAGVVFNRADARDFERSVSGISLRSVSRAQATSASSVNGSYQDKRVGPLVHSVRGTKDEN